MSEGTLARSSGWMVSPGWDMAFIIASPVAIVPAMWLLVQGAATPEQLAIPVFAFATLGHHLPGYMRAYGDRELFERFKLRFLVVPPVLFGFALLLVQPAFFGLDFPPPASLQLLIVIWGTWHGLMQIYGFMRIYDAKQGVGHGLSQRLDLVVCFAIFIAGFLYSDSRMFGLMNLAWQVGVPKFGRDVLEMARLLGGVAIGAVAIAYVGNLLRERSRGRRMGAVKLCLALATGGIYAFSGLITTNLLLGAAMFEVFHAVQYLAIVWYFNRRLEERVGDDFGPLRFLFRNRWSSLFTYLAAIAAFGSIFLAMGTPGYGPIVAATATNDPLFLLFSAFFVTSSVLHYYYDGFIWKLHDAKTGRNLGVSGPALGEVSVPALLHFSKWGALALVVTVLVGSEISQPATAERAEGHIRALAALTPDVPQVRAAQILQLIDAGQLPAALELAEANAALRSRSHRSYGDVGRVHVAREDWRAAESAYREAIRLRPQDAVYHTDLARVLTRQGKDRLPDAARAYRDAIVRDPDNPGLGVELAAVEQLQGNFAAAAKLYEAALARSPEAADLRGRLLDVLLRAGDKARAVQVAQAGRDLAPDSGEAQFLYGKTALEAGQPMLAADAMRSAKDLAPDLPLVEYELGRAYVAAGQYQRAESALVTARQSGRAPPNVYVLLAHVYDASDREPLAAVAKDLFVKSAPDPATGYRTLGARFLDLDDYPNAVAAFEEALRLEPADPATRARLKKLRARAR